MLSKLNLRNRKGQAAMEFLMTYGWAILIAIIAIAALIAFGVLNVGKTSANICTLSAPLGCNAASTSQANGVTLAVANAGDVQITVAVNDATLTATIGGQARNCSGPANAINITADTSSQVTLTCTGIVTSEIGSKHKGTLSVLYSTATSSGVKSVSSGSFAQTVIA